MKKLLFIYITLNTILFANDTTQVVASDNLKIYMLYPFLAALLASFIVLCFTWINDNKNKKKAYKVLLKTILAEIELYLPIFEKLSDELSEIVKAIVEDRKPTYPTFNLYPDFLSEMKVKLIDHQENAEIIQKISECHFELSHMQSRLILHKNDIKKLKEKNKGLILQNIRGFSALINQDIQVFKDLRTMIIDSL